MLLFRLENSCATTLDPFRHSRLLSALALVLVSGNLVSLLLHFVRLFAHLASRALLRFSTGYAAQLFVSFDQVSQRLIVHSVIHCSKNLKLSKFITFYYIG